MSGKFTYYKLPNVLSAIKQDFQLENIADDNMLKQFIVRGIQRIGAPSQVKKETVTKEISNYQIVLPCNFDELHRIIIADENGGSFIPVSKNLNFLANSFNNDTNLNETYRKFGKFEIIDGIIYLSTDITATEAMITYDGALCCEDGFPMIRKDVYEALSNFVLWQYCLVTVKAKDQEKYYQANTYRDEFKLLSDRCRSQQKLPDEMEREYLAGMWNRLFTTFDLW
jgi:hypothetical protein